MLDPGERAVRFINNLTHTKGAWAGQPFRLRPWQEHRIVRPLFGTLKGGLRQYRTCYVEIPRKNGKTELAAAVALYMLLGDREQGAEVYSAAVDLEQASLAFNLAGQMVGNDADLSARLQMIPSRRRIVDPVSGSVYRAIPADAPSAHGFNASAIVADELHAWLKRDLYDVLTTSTGSRRQPLTFVITTAGWDRNSICYELHAYAEKVLDGSIIDPTFLPILYGAAKNADWTDEAVWRAANPALGDFRDLEEMRTSAKRAAEIPAQQNTFRRLYLCQWTEQSERAIDMDVWNAAPASVPAAELAGRPCFGGLDLASSSDLAAWLLLFPPRQKQEPYHVLRRFWIPGANVGRRVIHDRTPYDLWIREGLIEATEGDLIDYEVIRRRILEDARTYDIREIAYDPWNAIQLGTQLRDEGLMAVPLRQGFPNMAGPTAEFLALVSARRLAHGGDPVLRWMASNLSTQQDAQGNLKPDKGASREKIDGIVALIMALARAMQAGQSRSVYTERDLVVIG